MDNCSNDYGNGNGGYGGGLSYHVDVVMCIDVTGSMRGIIETVKANARSFYNDLMARMEYKGKRIDQLRVRVVAFRDYLADGDNAMLTTPFFTLPQEVDSFQEVVNSLQPIGGGDLPEDGLEALAYAMNSQWSTGGDKRRQIIVLWTDTSAHPLGYGSAAPNYPRRMARDFNELSDWWYGDGQMGKMDYNAKRLVIYAPDTEPWNFIVDSWDNMLFYPSIAGGGLGEVDYDSIIETVANSI